MSTMRRLSILVLPLSILLWGCTHEPTAKPRQNAIVDADACLDVELGTVSTACVPDEPAGTVRVDYTVASPGAPMIAVFVDGLEFVTASTPDPVTLTLATGPHSIVLCFALEGHQACSDPIVVDLPCKSACNQGLGNGPEGCDPGNSNHNQPSNDEPLGDGGVPGPGHGNRNGKH